MSGVDPTAVAWAAGIIEGEGSIQGAVRSQRDTIGNPLIYVRVRVVMTDADVLERLRGILGGTPIQTYENTQGLGSKQLYRWEVANRAAVSAVFDAIYPWMGVRRREQIDRVRQLMADHPPISNQERLRRTWSTRRANEVRV